MYMARTSRVAWPLLKFRQNKGYKMKDLVELLGVSNVTLNRLERGGIVSRVTAARYFKLFDIDLGDEATFPASMTVIDHGDRVAINFQSK